MRDRAATLRQVGSMFEVALFGTLVGRAGFYGGLQVAVVVSLAVLITAAGTAAGGRRAAPAGRGDAGTLGPALR